MLGENGPDMSFEEFDGFRRKFFAQCRSARGTYECAGNDRMNERREGGTRSDRACSDGQVGWKCPRFHSGILTTGRRGGTRNLAGRRHVLGIIERGGYD